MGLVTGESFETAYVAQSNVVEANFEPIASGASKVDQIIIPKDSDFDSGGMGQALLTNLDEANEILVAAAVIWDDVFDVRHRVDFKMLGFLGPNPTTKIKTRKSKGDLRMRITKDWLTDKGCDED